MSGSPRGRHRMLLGLAACLAIVTSVLASASPAQAVHTPISVGNAQRVAAVRTVIAPSTVYDGPSLGIGCRATAKATLYPVWTVSNVTSTSAYLRTLKVTFYPANGGMFLGAYLADGNGTQQGRWSNTVPVGPGGYVRTYTLNRTVNFGRNHNLLMTQSFHLTSPGSPGACTANITVFFYLRPV